MNKLLFPFPLDAELTLSEWANYWLETYVKPVAKPSGYEHYHDNLYKHILPTLGSMKLNDMSTAVVQRFFNAAAASGNLRNGGPLSAKSMKNMRVVLDVCCKRAVADGYMHANPVPLTVLKRCRTNRVETMSDDNQTILEDWLFEHPCSESAAIQIAMFTGARLGEVCALRWRDYDFETGRIHFRETVRRVSKNEANAEYGHRTEMVFSSTKTDASDRVIYLPQVLQDLMKDQHSRFSRKFREAPKHGDFIIFNRAGSHMDPDNLSSYFRKTLAELELPHVKFHALRHTFATRAVENGIDVATVSGILGHADVTTTTHYYVHPREDAMRRAMATIRPVSR